jgi:hypothetical protein
MKKYLLVVLVLLCGVAAHAQTKDEILVVATAKTFLTDKDESKAHNLLASGFRLYSDSSVVNSTALTTLEHYKKVDSRVGIAMKLSMRFVVAQSSASLFCITEHFRGNSKEPYARTANTLFLTKEKNEWLISQWQQTPYKNDYSQMEFGG